MTFKLVCIINSVLAFGFGIAFVVAAEPTMAMYATEGAPGLTPAGLLIANLLGAAFIGFAVVSFQARDAADSVARRAIALGFVVGNVIGAGMTILGITSGAVNALGWSTVAIYGLLAAGFAITGLAKSSA
jgi:fluoride ion exporter CrcB/FEX